MFKVDLSQLLSRKSFTVLYTLFRNRYRVTTTALANFKANAFALFNIKCIKKIFKFLNTFIETLKKPILVRGYNKQIVWWGEMAPLSKKSLDLGNSYPVPRALMYVASLQTFGLASSS
jgi:hypothetical protein